MTRVQDPFTPSTPSLFTNLEACGVELPLLGDVQSRHSHTTRDEHITAGDGNLLKWSLNTIKDAVQDAWAQLHSQGLQTMKHKFRCKRSDIAVMPCKPLRAFEDTIASRTPAHGCSWQTSS